MFGEVGCFSGVSTISWFKSVIFRDDRKAFKKAKRMRSIIYIPKRAAHQIALALHLPEFVASHLSFEIHATRGRL